ncbi:MAG: phosphoribosyltransferase family protein [Lysinibacillus sp.]
MKKEVTHCLLCTQQLQMQASWCTLLTKQFPPSICLKCENRFEEINSQTEHHALYTYNEAMKTYLHQYKFLQDVALAKVFRQQIFNLFKNERAIIVPIPMHPKKQKERTFAHMDELLKAANIPYKQCLAKTTIESQSTKTREERLQTAPLFKLSEGTKITNSHYILFDDICTTGTTLQHAKAMLEEAGVKTVRTVTLISG